MLTIKAEAELGVSIVKAVADAIDVAQRIGCWLEVPFNDVKLLVHPEDDVAEALDRAAKINRDGARKFVQDELAKLKRGMN